MPRLIWVFAEHTVIFLVLWWGGSYGTRGRLKQRATSLAQLSDCACVIVRLDYAKVPFLMRWLISSDSQVPLATYFLHTRPGFPWTRPGLGNVILHEGYNTTLLHDVSIIVLTSCCQFPTNVSMSTYKRGALLNFSWSKNVVILAWSW